MDYRSQIEAYIAREAQPQDKYAHQPRVYHGACLLGQSEGLGYDDDILHAACWLHDLGVFTGHRPVELAQLVHWDNVAYAVRHVPALLQRWGFPAPKIAAVQQAIAEHAADASPSGIEAKLLHDADILESLGAAGIARVLSKVGRDTRYPTHRHALEALARLAEELPAQLCTEAGRLAAQRRVSVVKQVLAAAVDEGV